MPKGKPSKELRKAIVAARRQAKNVNASSFDNVGTYKAVAALRSTAKRG